MAFLLDPVQIDIFKESKVYGGRAPRNAKKEPENLDDVLKEHQITIQPIQPIDPDRPIQVIKNEGQKTFKKALEKAGEVTRERILPLMIEKIFDAIIKRFFTVKSSTGESKKVVDKRLKDPAFDIDDIDDIVDIDRYEDRIIVPKNKDERQLMGAAFVLQRGIEKERRKKVDIKKLRRILNGGKSIYGMKSDVRRLIK